MNNINKNTQIILSIILAIIAFVFFTGGTILNPSYTDWLLTEKDPAQHYLGWEFFRNTPIFQWPLGSNPHNGLESSIVFTDSIPLFAFFFKAINFILPYPFQYQGLWVLTCFILQSIIAMKLLGLFTTNRIMSLVGSLFFLLSPIYLLRSGGHYALMGHWVILAALYLYFSHKFSMKRWLLLITLTALIHAYLLMMVLIIWGTDLIQRYFLKQLTLSKFCLLFFFVGLYTAFMMWGIGYFILGSGDTRLGYDHYNMNLYSLIDSNGIWSKTIPDFEETPGDSEGFNFLGIGMIVLIIPAVLQLFTRKLTFPKAKIIPILLSSLVLFIYAISNKITLGTTEILAYPLPEFTDTITQTFRVSGRFFWPVYYLIYLLVLNAIFKYKFKKITIAICISLLSFQIWDSNQLSNMYKNRFMQPKPFTSSLKSPIWKDIAHKYSQIIYVLPHNSPKNWVIISQFAMENDMSINAGYFARINQVAQNNNKLEIIKSIEDSSINQNALYIFMDNNLWNIAINQLNKNDIVGTIDGIKVLLPGYKNCDKCNDNHEKDINLVNINKKFKANSKKVNFNNKGNGSKHLLNGWYNINEQGVWSDGESSSLRIDIPKTMKDKLAMTFDANAYLTKEQVHQEVEVIINGHKIGFLKYNIYTNTKIQKLVVPKHIIEASNGRILMELMYSNPIALLQDDKSKYTRRVSLELVSIVLEY